MIISIMNDDISETYYWSTIKKRYHQYIFYVLCKLYIIMHYVKILTVSIFICV